MYVTNPNTPATVGRSRGNNVFGFEDLPNNIFGPVVREIVDPEFTTTS